MTGMIDRSDARVEHGCDLPAIRRFGPPIGKGRNAIPTTIIDHPEGTRFHCDGCGTVWVVWRQPPIRGRYCYMAGGLVWRRETRAERRRRLGLRWWRR